MFFPLSTSFIDIGYLLMSNSEIFSMITNIGFKYYKKKTKFRNYCCGFFCLFFLSGIKRCRQSLLPFYFKRKQSAVISHTLTSLQIKPVNNRKKSSSTVKNTKYNYLILADSNVSYNFRTRTKK